MRLRLDEFLVSLSVSTNATAPQSQAARKSQS